MLTPAFAFNQTCVIRRWVERGISGDVYGPDEQHRCRVHFKTKWKIGERSEVLASGSVWMEAGIRLDPHDRFVFDGKEYNILSCHPSYDLSGAENHVEVEIQ